MRRPAAVDGPRRIGALDPSAPLSATEDDSFDGEIEDDLIEAEDLASLDTAAAELRDLAAAEATVPEVTEPAAIEVVQAQAPAPPPVQRPTWSGPARRPMTARGPAVPAQAGPAPAEGEDGQLERTATAPQLRRFIKSRAYVPMHELRRRFGINGGDDDVTPVDMARTRVFVGLPDREGRLLGELLRAGDIGYELSLDPISPIVVGVYPMRPVTRG